MMKLLKIIIGLAVVVALALAGIKAVKQAKAKDASQPQAKIYPVVVSKLSPKISKVKLTLPYLAIVGNDKDVQLSSKIVARVMKIKKSGSYVKKGELIVSLDTTDIENNLISTKDQIKATNISLENLIKTHKRTQELLKVQGASIEESQKEENIIAKTKASLNALEQKKIGLENTLSYAQILSPVDGVISKTYLNKGSISAPGKPLVEIKSKNGFYLLVRVPNDLAIKGVEFNGKLHNVTPLGTTFNGLAEYKVYTNDAKLISGDRVEVNVVTFNGDGQFLPFDAILNRDGKSYILVIQGDNAIQEEIHIVQSAQQGVIILENLENKQIVIAKPDILLKLTSGYKLKVKD